MKKGPMMKTIQPILIQNNKIVEFNKYLIVTNFEVMKQHIDEASDEFLEKFAENANEYDGAWQLRMGIMLEPFLVKKEVE